MMSSRQTKILHEMISEKNRISALIHNWPYAWNDQGGSSDEHVLVVKPKNSVRGHTIQITLSDDVIKTLLKAELLALSNEIQQFQNSVNLT